jgi:hypothetical protein
MPPLHLKRTLKFALRGAWDYLGFVCAISLTVFAVAILAGVAVVEALRAGHIAILVTAILAGMGIVPPFFAGACYLVHRILSSDEPSYWHLWHGAIRMWGRSVVLFVVQILVLGLLWVNMLLYLHMGTFLGLLMGVTVFYGMLFWGMNCLYHWPLLVAGEVGILTCEDGRHSGLGSVFRNGFLLAFSAPGFTFCILVAIMGFSALLFLSGVGMVLLWIGLLAFLTTQATRDQLVRFGVIPPPPDPDEPVPDEGWTLRGEIDS